MGVVGSVTQCCAGPRDHIYLPDDPPAFPQVANPVRKLEESPRGEKPTFQGEVSELAPAGPAPTTLPAAAVEAAPASPPPVVSWEEAPVASEPPAAPAPEPAAAQEAPAASEPPAPVPEPAVAHPEPAAALEAAAASEPPAPAPEPAAVEEVAATAEEGPLDDGECGPSPLLHENKEAESAQEVTAMAEEGPLDDSECGPSPLLHEKKEAESAHEAGPAARAAEPEEELPPAEEPAPLRKAWLVVGGDAEKGGIVVRKGESLKSEMLPRLATGSRVEELEKTSERLHFRKLEGAGPEEGWVSMKTKDKELLVPA